MSDDVMEIVSMNEGKSDGSFAYVSEQNFISNDSDRNYQDGKDECSAVVIIEDDD